jgi:hypothetical protein
MQVGMARPSGNVRLVHYVKEVLYHFQGPTCSGELISVVYDNDRST